MRLCRGPCLLQGDRRNVSSPVGAEMQRVKHLPATGGETQRVKPCLVEWERRCSVSSPGWWSGSGVAQYDVAFRSSPGFAL